jgi:hypothetical protein
VSITVWKWAVFKFDSTAVNYLCPETAGLDFSSVFPIKYPRAYDAGAVFFFISFRHSETLPQTFGVENDPPRCGSEEVVSMATCIENEVSLCLKL